MSWIPLGICACLALTTKTAGCCGGRQRGSSVIRQIRNAGAPDTSTAPGRSRESGQNEAARKIEQKLWGSDRRVGWSLPLITAQPTPKAANKNSSGRGRSAYEKGVQRGIEVLGSRVACTRRNCNATGGPFGSEAEAEAELASVSVSVDVDVDRRLLSQRSVGSGLAHVYKLKVCNHISHVAREWRVRLAGHWGQLLQLYHLTVARVSSVRVSHDRDRWQHVQFFFDCSLSLSLSLCLSRRSPFAVQLWACPLWALQGTFKIKWLYCRKCRSPSPSQSQSQSFVECLVGNKAKEYHKSTYNSDATCWCLLSRINISLHKLDSFPAVESECSKKTTHWFLDTKHKAQLS